MPPPVERTILPETIATRTVEHIKLSIIGLARRRGVSMGQTADGTRYVQLGSVEQVSLDLETGDSIEGHGPTTPNDLFRRSNNFLGDHSLEGLVDVRSIDQIRAAVTQGGDLIVGEYTLVTAPGQPIRTLPERRAIWAPTELAFGDDWHIVEE